MKKPRKMNGGNNQIRFDRFEQIVQEVLTEQHASTDIYRASPRVPPAAPVPASPVAPLASPGGQFGKELARAMTAGTPLEKLINTFLGSMQNYSGYKRYYPNIRGWGPLVNIPVDEAVRRLQETIQIYKNAPPPDDMINPSSPPDPDAMLVGDNSECFDTNGKIWIDRWKAFLDLVSSVITETSRYKGYGGASLLGILEKEIFWSKRQGRISHLGVRGRTPISILTKIHREIMYRLFIGNTAPTTAVKLPVLIYTDNATYEQVSKGGLLARGLVGAVKGVVGTINKMGKAIPDVKL